MQWINVNEDYLDFLRKSEPKIPHTNYENKYKPFFGVLFETENLIYITQISHPQKRHYNMKQQKDFYKIYDPNDIKRLIAVVNLNYMFPIPKSETSPFKKKDIEKYRAFKDSTEKSKYLRLLDIELKEINKLNLSQAALNIYKFKYDFPDSRLSKRCIDFKHLEKISIQFQPTQYAP